MDADARKRLESRLTKLTGERRTLYDRRTKARSKTTQAQLDRAMSKLEEDITSIERALK